MQIGFVSINMMMSLILESRFQKVFRQNKHEFITKDLKRKTIWGDTVVSNNKKHLDHATITMRK